MKKGIVAALGSLLLLSQTVHASEGMILGKQDRVVFSQAYNLDKYTYFGWDVQAGQDTRYYVQYEIVKNGKVVKTGYLRKGETANGMEPKGPGEYLLVLKCQNGYSQGCSATGNVVLAME
ncbi:hypothetical protein [Baia soyae]|uniref:Uncharacterized protein n=1 Tax=Baia soyae TaxID=1544746 RepID=A0A4R2RTI8_9BACL|nr:hypothetical protein [Baia soyae]TCP65907.1 hypothetical protein EDD57_1292 [Baia soyae]